MRAFGLIHVGVLPLLLEAMSSGYAQPMTKDQEGSKVPQGQEARPPEGQEGRPKPQEEKRKPTRPDEPQRPRDPRPAQPGRPTRPDEPQRPPESRPQPQPQPQAPPNRPTRPDRPQRPPDTKPQPGRPNRPDQPQLPTERPMSPIRPLDRDPGRRGEAPRDPQRQTPFRGTPTQSPNDNARQHRGAWPERRARDWQAEHRSWQERGGYEGYRIPAARYRGSFGPSHGFRMFGSRLIMVDEFPRFQFGGLWFGVLDPWPEYWSDDWYDDDDLYIEWFAGGYYLRNRRYPMDRMALTVYL